MGYAEIDHEVPNVALLKAGSPAILGVAGSLLFSPISQFSDRLA
jgi:hypothetical protein